jgi:hypothetical protein
MPKVGEDWDPQVGEYVCDCRFQHVKIKEKDGDDIVTDDGFTCSIYHCCSPTDHKWEHPHGSPEKAND